MKRRRWMRLGLGLLLLLVLGLLAASRTPTGAAVVNVVEYRLRAWWWSLTGQPSYDPTRTGSFSGTIRTADGEPLPNAVALVSSVRGEVYQARSDVAGAYRVDGVPPGRYVPMSGAWGFAETNGPALTISVGQERAGVDFTLARYQPLPVAPTALTVGPTYLAASDFPTPLTAHRIPFTFTLDSLVIEGGQFYVPATITQTLPTIFIIYPSPAINWSNVSAAMAHEGFALITVGPDADRGLDIEGHVRDFRAVFDLWQAGRFAALAPGATLDYNRWLLMSGSFGSLMLFRALRDLPPPPAIVSVGGISDAFLGIQSLYSTELKIPPPYDTYVAALGQPDRDPAFFFGYSPLFYADHLPPIFIIHSYGDEVIPYNQATVLSAALDAHQAPHETLLYHDTTHYLDAYNPTESTYLVFQRAMAFARAHTAER
jgi:hypothetical protein